MKSGLTKEQLLAKVRAKLNDQKSDSDGEGAAPRSGAIAVVGVACRLPGDVRDLAGFWKLLEANRDAITEIPQSRFDVSKYYSSDGEGAGRISTKWGGFLSDVDQFDPQFFGISPREAKCIDPQQRIFLELAWEALEDANQNPEELVATKAGVYAGVFSHDYSDMQFSDPSAIDSIYVGTGGNQSVIAGRVSYTLGLRGPSLSVNTACSSSLVAIHLACQGLRSGETGLAIAGGVNLILGAPYSIALSQGKAMASDGRCKTFDSRADGYVRSEGAGVVVLKRLEDAIQNGDPIYALIRGSMINQDGASSGLTAPSGPAQRELTKMNLAQAGLTPDDISYCEAHGTGTPLGDPIEANSLIAELGNSRTSPLVLGSVKANIGHAESAAGVAGLLKVIGALKSKMIPAQLHFQSLNPQISIEGKDIIVPDRNLAWKVTHGPRRALVNSFGFSGTNAQIIVEEYVRPGDESQGIVQGNAQEDVYYPVLLSGRSKAHLRRTVSHFMNEIDDISPIAALAGVSLDGRALMSERLGLVARSSGELKEKLRLIDSAVDGDSLPGGVFRYSQPDNGVRQKVAFLFTGQGSQYPMMGRALMARYQEFMEPLEECRKILRGELPIDLFDILFDPTRSEKLLSQPLFAQPALCSIEYATARLWMALGVRPDALMGHSMGEYVAAAVAGCISLEDAMRLVVGRVKLVDTLPRGGEMGAVNLAHDRVAARLKELGVQVVVAAINGPDNTVISGNGDHVKQALAAFEKDGVKVKLLAVGWASHSPLVDPILEEFGKVASSVTYRKPELKLVSNLTGTWVGDEDIRGDYWVQHLRSAVQFNKGIKVLLSDGHKVYIEMAPGTALLSMGQLDPLSDESCLWIPSMRKDRPDLQQFSEGVAALAVRGRKIHVGRALKEPNWRSKGRLPLTPMLKQRYWLAPRVPVVDASQKGEHPLLQQKWDMAEDSGRTVYTSHLSINDFGFIADHKVYGHVIVPGATYCEIALAAARLRFGTERIAISDVSVVRALRLEPNKMRQLQLISQAERNSGLEKWKLFSRPIREDGSHGPWALHASGSMSRLGEAEIRTGPSVGELSEVVSSQGHYKKCALHGIEYGKAFQGIVSLWSKGASGGCVIKKPEGVSTTRYLFHPTLLDACFQTVYFAMNSIKGADGADIHPAFMPVGFEAIRIHSKIPNDLRATVRMRDNPSDRAMTCDIYAFDESGSLVAEIIGFSLVEATPDALKRAIRDEESLDDWMYSVIWQSETSATAIDTAGKNAAFRIVRAPTQFSSLTHSIPMAEFEGEPTAVSQDLAVVVDLTGMDPRSSDDMQRACLEVGQVHLKLRKKGHSKERRLLIVLTKGAGAVEGSEARLASASAYAVSSYVRAVIQEHPELKTRLIDLDRELGVDELQGLAQAAFESSEWQWLHRNGRLFRPRFQRVRSVRAHSDVESRNVFKDGMVVVTGGTGAIGLELIDWLVTRREVKDLIVIARRLPQGQAQERFAKLESQGARILICQADLSNEAGIDVARQQVMRSGKRISAVIHAAGVMNMCVTDSETAQSLQMGTGAKVDGLRALDSILADQPTTPLVLFSSASAWIPASGQASYASSNGFLDGYSIQSRAEGRRVVSINWGAWRGLGMATQSSSGDKAIDWDAGGFGSFDASHGFQLLERALLDDLSGTIFVPVDWEKVGRHFQGDDLNPILKDLVVSDQSSPDIVEADVAKSSQSLKAQLLLLPSNDERLEALEEKVRGEAAKVLGLASFNDVPSSEGLMSLGMDSLMAVEFRNRLKKSVGDDGAKPLPATLIFAYPNCQAIAQFILDDVLQARVPEEAADESLGDDELDRLISESGVNEKELQAMIQKLKGSA